MLDRMLSAFSIAARLPLRVGFTFDPSRLDFWLPVVGVAPALLNLLLWTVLTIPGGIPQYYPHVTAALLLIVQYWCFNLFHLDGLMDSADAFMGNAAPAKRQAILKDSRIGVYGFFAGFASLALKLALLGALLPDIGGALAVAVFLFPVAGRFGAALIPGLVPPAGSSGLGALMKDASAARAACGALAGAALWILLSGVVVSLLTPLVPLAPLRGGFWLATLIIIVSLVLLAPLVALFYARLYRRHIGGFTGDAQGAAIESAELLCLLGAFVLLRLYSSAMPLTL